MELGISIWSGPFPGIRGPEIGLLNTYLMTESMLWFGTLSTTTLTLAASTKDMLWEIVKVLARREFKGACLVGGTKSTVSI